MFPSNKIICKIRKLNPERTYSFFKVILGIDKREIIHSGFRDLQLSSKYFESYLSMPSCFSSRIKKQVGYGLFLKTLRKHNLGI